MCDAVADTGTVRNYESCMGMYAIESQQNQMCQLLSRYFFTLSDTK